MLFPLKTPMRECLFTFRTFKPEELQHHLSISIISVPLSKKKLTFQCLIYHFLSFNDGICFQIRKHQIYYSSPEIKLKVTTTFHGTICAMKRAEISSEYRRSVTQCEESDPDHLKAATELAASTSRRGATLDIRTLMSSQGRLVFLKTSSPVAYTL